jgi:two-component system, chemotaxis family, chemotaxis protein CheY
MAISRKILVVDDSTYQRSRAKNLLASNDYIVLEAEDGIDAVQIYRKTLPDLVIMDINMAVMDGIEAIRYIKKINSAALIIVLSALGDEKSVVQAIRAGAREYMVKPFKPDLLLSTVKKFLAAGSNTEQLNT